MHSAPYTLQDGLPREWKPPAQPSATHAICGIFRVIIAVTLRTTAHHGLVMEMDQVVPTAGEEQSAIEEQVGGCQAGTSPVLTITRDHWGHPPWLYY